MKNKGVVCVGFFFFIFVFTAMALIMVWFNQLLDRKTANWERTSRMKFSVKIKQYMSKMQEK